MSRNNDLNTAQRTSRDSNKGRSKILSFSKPKYNEPDPITYEVIGQYPSIKIYSENQENDHDVSSVDNKLVNMLMTPKNKNQDTHEIVDSSHQNEQNINEHHHKRQKTYCQSNFNKHKNCK